MLFFGFIYFKYHEDLPIGIQGEKADALALNMLEALDYNAYKNTKYIEWTYKKRRYYKWNKENNTCEVNWKEYKVSLDLNDHSKSKAYVHSFKVDNGMAKELIVKAKQYFNNDSFWLVAPYKVFDEGVERRLVKTEHNTNALLVTYTANGTTPGDSYLWLLDSTNKPKSFKMWTSLLPIDGIEATWNHWVTTESGAQLPTFHNLAFLGIEIDHIKASK